MSSLPIAGRPLLLPVAVVWLWWVGILLLWVVWLWWWGCWGGLEWWSCGELCSLVCRVLLLWGWEC